VGIIYGLVTAICYGSADFLATRASRRIGPLRSLYLIQLFGLVAIVAIALVRRDAPPPLSLDWLWAVAFGAANFAGIYFLYRAFTVGSLSVCSPIASGYAVVTGLLAWATGERLPPIALLGTVSLVIGVVIVARGPGDGTTTLAGVPDALAAAGFVGIASWGFDRLTADWGWVWPALATRAVMSVLALLVLAPAGDVSPRPAPGIGRLVVAASLFDATAAVAFDLGVARELTTTTTSLSSLYNTVAILLALLFLKERLTRRQCVGLAAIVVGILLVSL
jgi:drug/metabolite transporter (DMT)-like permease